jgi:hypothetical protein
VGPQCRDAFLDRHAQSHAETARSTETTGERFPRSNPGVVGLAGLEPAASSLSGFSPRARFPRMGPATWTNDVLLETAGDC